MAETLDDLEVRLGRVADDVLRVVGSKAAHDDVCPDCSRDGEECSGADCPCATCADQHAPDDEPSDEDTSGVGDSLAKAGPVDEPRGADGRWTASASGVAPTDPRALAVAREHEARFRDAPVEHLLVVTRDGRVLASVVGDESSADVNIPPEAEGGLITHNHPTSSGPDPRAPGTSTSVPTLSDIDIRSAVLAGVAEVRAISQETGKVYSMRLDPAATYQDREEFQRAANDYLHVHVGQANEAFKAAGGEQSPTAVRALLAAAKAAWSDTWAAAARSVPDRYAYEVIG